MDGACSYTKQQLEPMYIGMLGVGFLLHAIDGSNWQRRRAAALRADGARAQVLVTGYGVIGRAVADCGELGGGSCSAVLANE